MTDNNDKKFFLLSINLVPNASLGWLARGNVSWKSVQLFTLCSQRNSLILELGYRFQGDGYNLVLEIIDDFLCGTVSGVGKSSLSADG